MAKSSSFKESQKYSSKLELECNKRGFNVDFERARRRFGWPEIQSGCPAKVLGAFSDSGAASQRKLAGLSSGFPQPISQEKNPPVYSGVRCRSHWKFAWAFFLFEFLQRESRETPRSTLNFENLDSFNWFLCLRNRQLRPF